jgi:hypothetical protein
MNATEEKITIIEGPPPVFEEIQDGWAMGLNEGPFLFDLVLTRLRTFNGAALVERCHRAWSKKEPIVLEYRDEMGLPQQTPIMAARTVETTDGPVLLLWLRVEHEEVNEEEESEGSDEED